MARLTNDGDNVKPDEVQTAMALGNAVIQAISGRNTAYANRSVGDFIAALRRCGVADSDDLHSIHYDGTTGHISVDRGAFGAIVVREVTR